MNSWGMELGVLVLGLAMLAKGAGWLVDGGASLARRFGVSPLVIGLTVIAWGTSVPELVVSGLAAWEGRPASSLGNVLGSNIANIGLVLGACALVLPSILLGRIRLRELVWLFGSLAGLWAVCADTTVSRIEAGLLLVAFGLYNVIVMRHPKQVQGEQDVAAHTARFPWLAVIVGSLLIALGANFVMRGATGLAERVGMADSILGLTILAVGTPLPELFAGVASAAKGHVDMGFGNVIGSNVFNSLAVMGFAGMIHPFGGTPEAQAELGAALVRDFPTNLAFSIVLVTLPLFFKSTAGRLPGGLLLVGYFGYIGYLASTLV